MLFFYRNRPVLSICLVKHNSSLIEEPVLVKLCTVALYNTRIEDTLLELQMLLRRQSKSIIQSECAGLEV